MAELTLRRWIKNAKRGEQLVYHRGFLLRDRQNAMSAHDYKGIGMTLWAAYLRGQVTLAQRRIGEGCYEYIAFKA